MLSRGSGNPVTFTSTKVNKRYKKGIYFTHYYTYFNKRMERLIIYPTIKKPPSKKNGTCALHVAVLLDNKRIAFPSLKRRISPVDWDDKKRVVKDSHPNAGLINAQIKKYVTALEADMLKKDLLNIRINKEVVRQHVKRGDLSKDFLKYCRLKIEQDYAKDTKRVYLSEVNKIEKFSPAVSFRDFNKEWFDRYKKYMTGIKGNLHNTVWKSFKFLRSMLEAAVKDRIISENPLQGYESPAYIQGIPDYLEWTEVMRFKKELRENQALSNSCRLTGWYFLLSCMSGLRFGDAVKFTPEGFIINDQGGSRLLLNTTKTGEIVSISFTDDLKEVVEQIKDRPINISNQAYNQDLKIIGVSAKIPKDITSHMGRHSFGMHCAEIGLSIDETQKLMGHRKRETTEIYYRIKDKRLDDSLKDKWNK